MNEETRKNELLEAIDAMMAGGKMESGGDDEELRQLVLLSQQLLEAPEKPDARFTLRLEKRIRELKDEAAASSDTSTAEAGVRPSGRWLPSWLSLPRAAAALAVMILTLGAIGLAGAIITGGGPGSRNGTEVVADSQRREGTESEELRSLSDQKATGVASGDAGDESSGSPPGYAIVPGSSDTGLPGLPAEQRVIQTADYEIDVPEGDFQEKFDQVTAMAGRYGGYVVSADSRQTGDEGALIGRITIRIANVGDNFSRAQGDLEALGTIISREISGQDVTEEYVDLQSRLRNAEAQETQLLELMKRAQTVDEILMVQSRLSEVQAQIEQIKGRMKYMEARTDFATINVDLREENAAVEDGGGETDWGFVESLKYAGWLAVQTVNFVIVSLGVIVPVGLLALIAWLTARRIWIWRRR